MKLGLLALFAALCLLLLANKCNEEERSLTVSPVADPLPLARKPACVASEADPFFCVKQACTSLNGSYNFDDNSCECPNNQQNFSAHQGGICLFLEEPLALFSVSPSTLTANDKPIISLGDILFLTHYQGKNTNSNDNIFASSFTSLIVGELSTFEQGKLERDLADMHNDLKIKIKLPLLLGDPAQLSIVVGSGEARKALLDNLNIAEIAFEKRQGAPLPSVARYYWEPDARRWLNLLRRTMHENATLLNLSTQGDEWSALKSALTNAWAFYSADKKNADETHFFTQDGCAGHCILKKKKLFNNFNSQEIKEYGGGLLVRHQIIIEDPAQRLFHSRHLLLEIDSSNSPNLVYQIEISPEEDSGDLVQKVEIFTHAGGKLLSSQKKLYAQFKQELLLRDASSREQNAKSSIVLCEAGFSPSAMINYDSSKFHVGPHTQSSFWGWLKNDIAELTLAEQLSGFKQLSEINSPYVDGGANLSKHALSDSLLATQRSSLRIIPISIDQCFASYDKWKNNVRPFARVVNVSASLWYDFASCEQNNWFRQSIASANQSFLWVLSAGNQAHAHLNPKNVFSCPQSLSSRQNIIVVSAKNSGDDSIASYTNFGQYYADIFADGTGFFPNEVGTSFAAPRVSRVAALLAERFPFLSIEQIRAAILLGARIPYVVSDDDDSKLFAHFMPARSGGILDETFALRTAEYIAQFYRQQVITMKDANTILRKISCTNSHTSISCQLAEMKIKWMSSTQIFPKGDIL